MSNEVIMTIAGNVVEEPTMRRIPGGTVVTNFRVASTSRRYDREQQGFVDNTTVFITVSAWRALGENVQASLHKGHPVVVTGRFTQRDYVVNEQPRSSYTLEASSVGHDLSRGVTTFSKIARSALPPVILDTAGSPADESGNWLAYENDARLDVQSPDGFDGPDGPDGADGPDGPDGPDGIGGGDPAARGLAYAS